MITQAMIDAASRRLQEMGAGSVTRADVHPDMARNHWHEGYWGIDALRRQFPTIKWRVVGEATRHP